MAHNSVICDRCGFRYKAHELIAEPQTGYLVCRLCVDPRRQINMAPRPTRPQIPWSSPPMSIPVPFTLNAPSLGAGSVTINGRPLIAQISIPLSAGSVTISSVDAFFYPLGMFFIMAGTLPTASNTDAVDKIHPTTGTREAGTNMSTGATGSVHGVCIPERSHLVGVWPGNAAKHEKYIHATDVSSSEASVMSSPATSNGGSACNSETGIFAGGGTSSGTAQNKIEKLTFSTSTVSLSSTTLSATNNQPGHGIGIAAKAILCGGRPGGSIASEVRLWTYATDGITTTDALDIARTYGWTFGNLTHAYHGDGQSGGFFGFESMIERYAYSTDTWTTIHDLGNASSGLIAAMGTSNNFKGFVACGSPDAGGFATGLNDCHDFEFATDTNINGFSVGARQDNAHVSATSSAPGWQ